jgi:hypothetical protein
MIQSLIFSYQNKNLKLVVDQLIQNTKNDMFVTIFDKHSLDRSSIFKAEEYRDNVEYHHIFWDEIIGPAEYKSNWARDNASDHVLFLSDDTIVSKDWDEKLLHFLEDKNAIVSGKGVLKLKQVDAFFFQQDRNPSSNFTLSNFIDRNFIFGKTEILKNIYPKEIKYRGEEELLALNLFNNKIEIFSGPSNLYEDLKLRTIENSYTTFSIEHNYNLLIDKYLNAPQEFLDFHGIDKNNLNKLPYNPDDVQYNPYSLSYQEIDARKFLLGIKEIS